MFDFRGKNNFITSILRFASFESLHSMPIPCLPVFPCLGNFLSITATGQGRIQSKVEGGQFAEWAPKIEEKVGVPKACINFWALMQEKFSGFPIE